ncbi:MAG: hypothetical protein N2111_14260 [Candidatus Sumerlaeaceae bacterium]|nr:hypothetical protein [Candidatus Sumerlaeaceae bacterium]
MTLRLAAVGLIAMVLTLSAEGAINIPSDGSDGAFNITTHTVVDLSEAQTANWDEPSTNPGKGIYDPQKWAVVFKFTSVSIAPGATVTFKNHPSRAPVVWLCSGSFECSGTVKLDGAPGHPSGYKYFAEGGPGGFHGGTADQSLIHGSSGLGIGGGSGWRWGSQAVGGSFGSLGGEVGDPLLVYNTPRLLPLIGGSGGSGGTWNSGNPNGGGGGGGAILIAARNTIGIWAAGQGGGVYARGGDGAGGGAGGGIRLVAERIVGDGALVASGGPNRGSGSAWGGAGRICVEGTDINYTGPSDPAAYVVQPVDATPMIWPPASAPSVRLVSLGGQPLPADPRGQFNAWQYDLVLNEGGTRQLVIETRNVPTTWSVTVLVTPIDYSYTRYTAAFQSGTEASATWTVDVNVGSGIRAIQARAYKP